MAKSNQTSDRSLSVGALRLTSFAQGHSPSGMARHERDSDSPLGEAEASRMAGSTGLEPAASAVTGQRSNQLNYDPLKNYR